MMINIYLLQVQIFGNCTSAFVHLSNIFFVSSRISDSLRTQPPTQRLLSLLVPWPIRFTAWCAHVVMPVKIFPPFFSSCVRRKGSSNVGLHPPVHSLASSWLCTGLSQQGALCPEDCDYSAFFFSLSLQRCEKTKNSKSSSFVWGKSSLF